MAVSTFHDALSSLQIARHALEVSLAKAWRNDEVWQESAEGAIFREAEGSLGCRVEFQDPAVAIDDDHGIERGFENSGVSGIAPP
jgi:hypothetical protein